MSQDRTEEPVRPERHSVPRAFFTSSGWLRMNDGTKHEVAQSWVSCIAVGLNTIPSLVAREPVWVDSSVA